MPKIIHIDAARQEVRPLTIGDGVRELQRLVGGYIEVALQLPGGHVLYVDEEGLFKPQRHFFRMAGIERPYAGNGVIVGPEQYDAEGEYLGTDDVSLPLAMIKRAVRFVTRAQADAWATATAYEPEVSFTPEGKPTEVIATRGAVWGAMPKPEEE